MSELYNTPLYKVVYYDLVEKKTVIKNKVFTFTVDRLVNDLKHKNINNLVIERL